MTLDDIAILLIGVLIGWITKIPVFLPMYCKWEDENEARKAEAAEILRRLVDTETTRESE